MKSEGIHANRDAQVLKKAGIQGGAIAGFLLALFVILFKEISGFSNLPSTLFSSLWPVMIFNGTLAGTICGLICSRYAIIFRQSQKNRAAQIILLISGFVICVLLQQLSSRYALRAPAWNETLGRFQGGPLGEPNIETIATGVIGGIYFLSLSTTLAKNLSSQKSSLVETAIKTLLPGVVIWSGIYLVYVLLLELGILTENFIPWKSSAIFMVEFPHPERVVLFIVFCFIFTIIMVKTLNWNYHVLTQNGSRKDQAFLERVSELIEQNMRDHHFGPEQLAKALGMSKGHLNRRLNEVVNSSTTKFILKSRLDKAAILLQQDYDNISQIAFHVGFNNLSYFNKCFKQQFHLTPSEYKKQKP